MKRPVETGLNSELNIYSRVEQKSISNMSSQLLLGSLWKASDLTVYLITPTVWKWQILLYTGVFCVRECWCDKPTSLWLHRRWQNCCIKAHHFHTCLTHLPHQSSSVDQTQGAATVPGDDLEHREVYTSWKRHPCLAQSAQHEGFFFADSNYLCMRQRGIY